MAVQRCDATIHFTVKSCLNKEQIQQIFVDDLWQFYCQRKANSEQKEIVNNK